MTSAFGKVILLGEHAVVHGHAALAGALDAGLRCTVTPRAAGAPVAVDVDIRLRVPAWGVDASTTDEHALGQALRALVAHLDAPGLAVDVDVDTRLPAAAGLGSSAALSVALARALSAHLGRAPGDDAIEAMAASAERCFHENPSGVDVALATRGGLGLFVRGQGLKRIVAPPLTVAIGLSGQPRRTADMVARVAALREREPGATDARLAALGALAHDGARVVSHGDVAALGELMLRAHAILGELGVSTPTLDELVAVATRAGAAGAKLTGAGGGGAVVAVAADRPRAEAIARALGERGHDAFVATVGALP